MAKGGKGSNPEYFDSRIKIDGPDAEIVTKHVHAKMNKDKRPTINNTVAAIVIEWAEMKNQEENMPLDFKSDKTGKRVTVKL